ncbi:MAG: YajQ family cyclic di-GMP-binding protein [Clostridium sp.]|uniref:YajQ family cyclic di-GMP-binding protein n=1 Tax=Clostridium sp. TaxID=1506 RepID=UPI002FC68A0C
MASSYSFDVVSEIDMQEVDNAINQAIKEIKQRYDFKGTKTEITLVKDEIKIISDSEYKLNSVIDVLKSKFVKRGVPTKAIDIGKVDNGSLGTVKVTCKLIKGIAIDKAKSMVADIKSSNTKVQAQIMDNQLRVSGKDKDDLQLTMQLLKSKDYGIAIQFSNYR